LGQKELERQGVTTRGETNKDNVNMKDNDINNGDGDDNDEDEDNTCEVPFFGGGG